MMLLRDIVVSNCEFPFERLQLLFRRDFDEDQAPMSEHLVIDVLQFRRKQCGNLRNEIVVDAFLSKVVVLVHFLSIGRPENIELPYVLSFESYLNVVETRKEGPIEVLKEVLVEILSLDSTEVVEPLHLFQSLTSLRLEVFGNPNNGCVNIRLRDGLQDGPAWPKVIVYIGYHHNPIFTIGVFRIFGEEGLKGFITRIESRG